MKSLLKSFKVKKSPFIMGNLRRPFTPRFGPRFFFTQKIAGVPYEGIIEAQHDHPQKRPFL